MKQSKLHKYFNILIRILIVVTSIYFIVDRILNGQNFDKLSQTYMTLGDNPRFPYILILLIVLMIVNLGIEAIKWRKLIAGVEHVNILTAVKAVLMGITVSIFSPNRVGEFFGRAFILKKADPMKGILLTVVGSMSQLLVTLVAGSLALVFFIPGYYPLDTELHHWLFGGVVIFVLGINTFMVLLFINVPTVSKFAEWATRKNWIHTIQYLRLLENTPKSLLIRVLLLSASRYVVFSCQFWIMLQLFGIALPVTQAMLIIPLTYLALALIPTYALSELGVRGSIALYLVGLYMMRMRGIGITSPESLAIVSATTAVWLLNLAFPALLGTVFVFNLRFFRK